MRCSILLLLCGVSVSLPGRAYPACQGNLPCYNATVNFVADGPLKGNEVTQERDFLLIFGYRYFDRQRVIAEGRRAAAYFQAQFGMDFSSLPDTAFLSGRFEYPNGVVFKPYIADLGGRFRLYSATTRNASQLFNKQVIEAGWDVAFTRQFTSTGRIREVIPAGSFSDFSMMAIFHCDPQSLRRNECNNILNPGNERAPIFFTFRTAYYLRLIERPSPFIYIDCFFDHEVFGTGRGRGYLPLRESNTDMFDGRVMLTFPSYL